MTKADQIRSLPSYMPAAQVAASVGCDVAYVHNLRSRDKHRARFRAVQRRGEERRRRARGVQPACRMEDNPFWASRDHKLIKMVKAERPRREIAEALGTTKSAVIGRWHRLVEAGLA